MRKRLKEKSAQHNLDAESRIKYHELDLGSMQKAWKSAREFARIEKRLDILVCNAAVSMTTMQELSSDGFDTMFTVNHLGHFAFTAGLLGISPSPSSRWVPSREES